MDIEGVIGWWDGGATTVVVEDDAATSYTLWANKTTAESGKGALLTGSLNMTGKSKRGRST